MSACPNSRPGDTKPTEKDTYIYSLNNTTPIPVPTGTGYWRENVFIKMSYFLSDATLTQCTETGNEKCPESQKS